MSFALGSVISPIIGGGIETATDSFRTTSDVMAFGTLAYFFFYLIFTHLCNKDEK